jgi:Rhamnan synthesis protein F
MGGYGVIPKWKFAREVARFTQQLRAIPEALWEPAAQRRHDAAFSAGFPVRLGNVPFADKAAIFLVWQPAGLANSTFLTCQHLKENGYAVLVVSNAPLPKRDIDALCPLVWSVLERPNFGYDFGGYRDGIKYLQRQNRWPDRLVILNDSIWYPIWPGDDTLTQLEQGGADISGTVLRQRGKERFLESYFYSISGAVLRNPAFQAFWRDLRLTSNKYKVIRRGERGFGRAMRAASISVVGLFDEKVFKAGISVADQGLLRQTLAYSGLVDPVQVKQAVRLADDGTVNERRTFILDLLHKVQFYSAFPVATYLTMRFPVLKKSGEPVSRNWRKAFLRAVHHGSLPAPLPEVLAEATGR